MLKKYLVINNFLSSLCKNNSDTTENDIRTKKSELS